MRQSTHESFSRKETVVAGSDFEHYFFNLGRTEGVDGRGKADNEGFCPFKDINVRHAITIGINRQAIVDNLLNGYTAVPVSQWPNTQWTNTNLQVEGYDPDARRCTRAGSVHEDHGGAVRGGGRQVRR